VHKLKRWIGSCALVIISLVMLGCHKQIPSPDIIMIGDCEHGIVAPVNYEAVKAIFPEAQPTDVLIAGGCYQSHFIKLEK